MPNEHHRWSHEVESGLTLRGADLRISNRPTVQFIHGIAFASRIYLPMLAPLNEEYGLFLQDLQGHGDSDIGGQYPGWQQSIDRISLVMDAHNLSHTNGPMIGMGHSYGASLQMIMAAQQPERFTALILLDPMILPQTMFELFENIDSNPMVDRIRKKTDQWTDRDTARRYLRSKTAFRNWHEDSIEAFLDHAMETYQEAGLKLRCPPDFEVEVLTKPLVTLWDSIPQIEVPTIIFHSDEPISPIGESCKQAAQINANIECVPMPGSHNFMLEHPEYTRETVLKSLRTLSL